MNKDLLEKYAKLKLEHRKIEAQLEFLQPAVLKEISPVFEGTPVTIDSLKDVGAFSITKRKIWRDFSPELMDLKSKVTELEGKEKAEGPATFEEVESVVFKEKKNT